jgi:TRAP-type transport system periplasmic protein
MIKHASKVMVGFMCLVFTWVLIPGVTVFAQNKPTELRYASPFPPAHPYSIADQKWFEKIEKETNGRVKIKPYWNGTLISGRESMREVVKGAADIAWIGPVYERSGVDIAKGTLDFFRYSSPEANIKIFWELFEKFPELRKEYDGLKILAVDVGAPLRLMTTKKPVTTAADLKGLKIRAVGDVFLRTLKALGTDAIGMPITEMMESLQKGIIHGVVFSRGDYKSLKLVEIVKYETENFLSYRGAFGGRAMSLDTWNKLPPDIQKILNDNKDWWSVESYRESVKPDDEGEAIAVKAGVQFVKMDDASIKKYNDTFDAENVKQAQALDANGFPGTKIYNEMQRLIKKYNTK